MKHISDKDNNPSNCSSRISRSKSDEGSNTPISKMEDFQSSMSAFSTRIESKNINNSRNFSKSNSIDSIDKKKINKEKKKVKFNPLISVVNIESFKKQNFEGNFSIEDNCQNEILKEENKKKCFLCSIF